MHERVKDYLKNTFIQGRKGGRSVANYGGRELSLGLKEKYKLHGDFLGLFVIYICTGFKRKGLPT